MYICKDLNLKFKPGKGQYYYASSGDLLFVRLTTWMNHSGIAVKELKEEYSLELSDILIVLDDVDLPFGKLRLRGGGSDGGHKGLGSVIYYLNSEEVPRLRIGIGNPDDSLTEDWVLSVFSEEEESEIKEVMESARESVFFWYEENIDVAMSKTN